MPCAEVRTHRSSLRNILRGYDYAVELIALHTLRQLTLHQLWINICLREICNNISLNVTKGGSFKRAAPSSFICLKDLIAPRTPSGKP